MKILLNADQVELLKIEYNLTNIHKYSKMPPLQLSLKITQATRNNKDR